MFFKRPKNETEPKVFNPEFYGDLIKDKKIQTPSYMFRPAFDGVNLLLKHYRKKWKTSIEQVCEELSPVELSGKLTELRSAYEEKDNAREALLIGTGKAHTYALVYVKEQGKEGFLLYDSAGLDAHFNSTLWLDKMACFDEPGFPPLYSVFDYTQADNGSCTTLALNVAVDATARKEGKYRIRDLLAFMEASKKTPDSSSEVGEPYRLSKEGEPKFFKVPLPESLARGVQITESLPKFTSQKVHKEQTLEEFRAKYSVLTKNSKGQELSIAGFAKLKGLGTHLRNIACWHYLTQLIEIHGKSFSKEGRDKFLDDAKALLKEKYQAKPPAFEEIKLDMYPELRALAFEIHEQLLATPAVEKAPQRP